MNKKILLIGNSEIVIFKFRLELVERLLSEGFEVYTAFPKTGFGDGVETAAKYGCKYVEVEMSGRGTNPLTEIKLIKSFKKVIGQIRPDVILTFTIKPNVYGTIAAGKFHIPCIINITGLGIAVENRGLLRLITTVLYRVALPKARCVFFQNSENEQFFASRHLADGKRNMLPGSGVNLTRFSLLDYPDEDDGIHFLFMARILREKGIDEYLDAAKAIHEKYPNTHFHILGMCDDESYRVKLEEYEKAGYVKYHGHQTDIGPFQQMNHCTVHPSYFEGMSNVLLESAASGKPLITTDTSGCREAVDDGVSGFICKPRDSADLIRCIERFLSISHEERRQMGLAGRKKIEREFDRQIVVGKYMEQIYKATETAAVNKKILLIGNSELVIFKIRLELIERLLSEGFEVYTAFPKTGFGDGVETAAKYGCKYFEVEMSGRGTNPLVEFKLINTFKKEFIEQIRPDVVLTFTIKPNVYGTIAAGKFHIPCIINITGLGTAVEKPGLLQFITTALYRFALPKTCCVFFQNSENEQFFASRHLADGKRNMLPGSGVNLTRFSLLDYPDEDDGIHFLFMARILREKGIDEYLDAAKAIHEKYPDTHFHILGFCDNENYLVKLDQYEKAGYIKYHGQQKDVVPFQKISHCTVHPSFYPEGMSNVLLESAASGRPLITTDRSGCREVIDDGVNGFICKQRDSADLIRCIERFLSLSHEERRQMGIEGRKKVEREFDRNIVVEKYMEQINKAIEK